MSLKYFQEKIGAFPDGYWGPGTFKCAMDYYKFSPERGAHFFAQTGHETGGFRIFSENLNYSADRLLEIFGKYFSNMDMAIEYERNPEKIANRVYANRMGNGDEDSGDGYKYRGRGALQLTGKNNYQEFADYMDRQDIIDDPDLIVTDFAFESAIFFFNKNKLWNICDEGISDNIITRLTIKINGGKHGLDDRINRTNQYYNWAIK